MNRRIRELHERNVRESVFYAPEWTVQTQRKRDCLLNSSMTLYGGLDARCKVSDEDCKGCRGFDYIPLGLGSLCIDGVMGFEAIRKAQGRHSK